jgi:hypothetical protein
VPTLATRSAVALLGAACLLFAAPASAQPGPWERESAQREARRVLTRVQQVMSATERYDARPAVMALGDDAWEVRAFAAVRLEACGLDTATCQVLRRAGIPGRSKLEANDPAVLAARSFASELEADPVPARPVEPVEALRYVSSMVTYELQDGDQDDEGKRALLESLLAYFRVVDEQGQVLVADRVLAFTDQTALLEDLGADSRVDALREGGAQVYAWYRDNRTFLYWHPARRRFLLDRDARDAGQSSDAYRRGTPWGPDEGPDSEPETPGR